MICIVRVNVRQKEKIDQARYKPTINEMSKLRMKWDIVKLIFKILNV